MQSDSLTHAGTGVEQKAQEDKIALALPGGLVNGVEHALHLIKLQVLDLPSGDSLERDAEQALGLSEMFRMLGSQVAKEAVNRAQADVSRADRVVAILLQMLQERGDLLHRQLLDGQLAGICFLTRHKLQHQFDAVPVTEDGMRAQCPLLRQVICKEPP